MKFRGRRQIKQRDSYIIKGILKRHPEGFGFVIPEDKKHPDIYIPSSKIGSALSNDKVEVAVYQKKRGGPRSYFGFIQSILKRDAEFVTGLIKQIDGQFVIDQHSLSFSQPIDIVNLKKAFVKEGDYVRSRLIFKKGFQNSISSFLKAEVVENLGSIGFSAKDDRKRIMAEHGIPFDFPQEVLKQAEALPDKVRPEDISDRIDLRDKAFVTIDGATAQDFDDAIFVEKHNNFYRLYVAIADVSYYVEEGTLLDQHALELGNSSYFPSFCSPMLPEKLSQQICSLREGEDRLVMVEEMDFNFQGERIRDSVYPSVILSKKRLTYSETQEILSALVQKESHQVYWDSLQNAKSLAEILIQKHKKELGFDLDIPEVFIAVDQKGETTDILKEPRLFSHKMIEQFMLSANKAVSRFLEKHEVPFIYRIHENPDPAKMKILENFAKSLSFSESFSSRKNIIKFLTQYKNHDKLALIHKLVLRSMAQAKYSAFNKGHYGLNFKSYTHFTSPIRRYCDLQIHRLIKKVLSQLEKGGLSQKELESQAQKISASEQNTVKAERRLKDIKMARFLKEYVGERFSGSVSSITNFGLFIELKDFFVEGLVRFQDLRGHWFADEMGLFAINKKTGKKIQFGDELEVLIRASHVESGQIDFKLLSHKGKKVF